MNSIKIASELSHTAARGQQQPQLTQGAAADDSDQILRLRKYFLPGSFNSPCQHCLKHFSNPTNIFLEANI